MPFTHNGKEYDPTAFDIDELLIIHEGDEIDVSYMFSEFNIYESLYNKCITGTLVVEDSHNIISNLPLMEGDLVKGLFRRNDNDPFIVEFDPDYKIEFMFEVVKVMSQTKIKQDLQVWTVELVSSTWTDHLSKRISKSYKQLPYSDMVIDIYNTYLSSGGLRGELPLKPLETEVTDNLWNIIIPNLKPYDAITFLTKRSFAGDFANYYFWEDKDKFNYKPFEKLLEAEFVETYWVETAQQFTNDAKSPNVTIDIAKPRYLNVLSFAFMPYHDVSASAMDGMLSHQLIKHDIFNKRVTDYSPGGEEAPNYKIDAPYVYAEEFDKTSHVDAGKFKMTGEYTNIKMSEEGSNTILSVYPDHVFQYDDQESFMPEKWLRQRRGQLAQMKFMKLAITTPGNLTRKVGDKIKLELMSPQWRPKIDSAGPTLDYKFQGNYIITSIRRKFTKDQFHNVMEIVKDNFYDLRFDLPDFNQAASIKVQLDGKGNARGL